MSEKPKVVKKDIPFQYKKANGSQTYSLIDTALEEGIAYYRIKAIYQSGASVYSKIVSVNNIRAVSILIYPNPTTDKLYLQDKDINSVKLIDATWKTLFSQKASNTTNLSINVAGLAKGNYIILINKENGIQEEKRFLKE